MEELLQEGGEASQEGWAAENLEQDREEGQDWQEDSDGEHGWNGKGERNVGADRSGSAVKSGKNSEVNDQHRAKAEGKGVAL